MIRTLTCVLLFILGLIFLISTIAQFILIIQDIKEIRETKKITFFNNLIFSINRKKNETGNYEFEILEDKKYENNTVNITSIKNEKYCIIIYKLLIPSNKSENYSIRFCEISNDKPYIVLSTINITIFTEDKECWYSIYGNKKIMHDILTELSIKYDSKTLNHYIRKSNKIHFGSMSKLTDAMLYHLDQASIEEINESLIRKECQED